MYHHRIRVHCQYGFLGERANFIRFFAGKLMVRQYYLWLYQSMVLGLDSRYFFPRRFLPESICLHFAQIQANKYFFLTSAKPSYVRVTPRGQHRRERKYFPSSSSLPFPKFRAEASGEKKGQAKKKEIKGNEVLLFFPHFFSAIQLPVLGVSFFYCTFV